MYRGLKRCILVWLVHLERNPSVGLNISCLFSTIAWDVVKCTFQIYQKLVEKQTWKRIKCLQFDNYLAEEEVEGGERLLVPQQISVSKGMNRTLLEMCLLLHCDLSVSFRAESVNRWSIKVSLCDTKQLCSSHVNYIGNMHDYSQ